MLLLLQVSKRMLLETQESELLGDAGIVSKPMEFVRLHVRQHTQLQYRQNRWVVREVRAISTPPSLVRFAACVAIGQLGYASPSSPSCALTLSCRARAAQYRPFCSMVLKYIVSWWLFSGLQAATQ